MRQYIYIIALALLPLVGSAQQRFASEIAPYETRMDSDNRSRKTAEYYQAFKPQSVSESASRTIFTLPDKWYDRVVVLHLENTLSAYALIVNGDEVLVNHDAVTPTSAYITQYLREGENVIDIVNIEPNDISTVVPVARPQFEGSYLCAYPSIHIHDMDIRFVPEGKPGDARLNISVALRNAFTQGQSVDVGYDIYDPQGNLLDFSVNKFEVEAGVCDTIKFSTLLYNTSANMWSPKNPKLYRVTLYTRRNGIVTEYIPRRVPLVDADYDDLQITRTRYNAAATESHSRSAIKRLKSQGVNTLSFSYPQPVWMYELCQELGVWVEEQPNINSEHEPTNKRVGGTPANNPTLAWEYLRRGASGYYRSRDYDNIVAYSLAGDLSGNGYNLYKLYNWFKDVETQRPIIYRGGAGEWNSDNVE